MYPPAADQGGNLRAMDSEGDAAHGGERVARLVAHEAGEGQQQEQQHSPNAEGKQNLPGADTQREKAYGETIIARAVYVVGPQSEDALTGPPTPSGLGGS